MAETQPSWYCGDVRSYGQFCSIARALDLVGDRWTLLIVRELLLQGPCRFTDVKNGLPGVATNLLSTRLKELEEAGLIDRQDEPPPVATALYRLTEDGRALEPVLKALGVWGLRHMSTERPDDAFQASWLAYAPTWFADGIDAGGPPAVVQLMASGHQAVLELRDGQIHTRPGQANKPDLVIDGPPRAVLGLLTGQMDLKSANQLGLSTQGKRELLKRILPHSATQPVRKTGNRRSRST
jgi:DNA-binding HxlR family transcriptional regulator